MSVNGSLVMYSMEVKIVGLRISCICDWINGASYYPDIRLCHVIGRDVPVIVNNISPFQVVACDMIS